MDFIINGNNVISKKEAFDIVEARKIGLEIKHTIKEKNLMFGKINVYINNGIGCFTLHYTIK